MDEGLTCAYTPPDENAIELLHKVASCVDTVFHTGPGLLAIYKGID